ncbi:MAG: hypothetical protein M2R45_03967 [Verrucomicrobia subdivision 3 bacterium]|nr:hypothetical protein [Limisphaerales bacterium]MCS1415513.1 hypothetical protein [Limisphaerales bacterium]
MMPFRNKRNNRHHEYVAETLDNGVAVLTEYKVMFS